MSDFRNSSATLFISCTVEAGNLFVNANNTV